MKTITMAFALTLLVGLLALPILAPAVEEGLVGYWAFEETEGDTASDLSGNGYDGTLMGNPQRIDGYFGGGLEFDGDGDEVNVPFQEDLNQETFTISAWANVAQGSAGYRAVVSSRNEPPTSGYIFYAEPGNTWQFWTGDGGWKSVRGPAVTPGEWQHIAGTYVDGTQKFYVNSEFVGETASVPNLNTSQELLIGAGANERSAHAYLFKGMIDEVRVYDRALNEDEIAKVMGSNPTAVEASDKIAVTWGQLKAR